MLVNLDNPTTTPDALLEVPCACGRSERYRRCCFPVHEAMAGTELEAMTRARFSAFVLGLGEFWWRTLHSLHVLKRRDAVRALEAFEQARRSFRYEELTLLGTRGSSQRGQVLAKVRASRSEQDCSFVELACYEQEVGGWRYRLGITRPAREVADLPRFEDFPYPSE